ncbi:hypothetical protein B0H10DRAFT_2208083 [Mycena sp. CBHHK59/15]|nr:hypothetical protein B0H10DRAFT_2208083 [Mycena sp. CBHHK59/15]
MHKSARQLVAALRDGGVPLISYHSLINGPDEAPSTWGATHACDMLIFGFPAYFVIPEHEKIMTVNWLKDLADMIDWTDVKELTSAGTIEIIQDVRWADLEQVAKIMKSA